MKDDGKSDLYESERKKFQYFDKNWNLILETEDFYDIHRNFNILYINRISKAKDPHFKNLPEEHPFKPTLSKEN